MPMPLYHKPSCRPYCLQKATQLPLCLRPTCCSSASEHANARAMSADTPQPTTRNKHAHPHHHSAASASTLAVLPPLLQPLPLLLLFPSTHQATASTSGSVTQTSMPRCRAIHIPPLLLCTRATATFCPLHSTNRRLKSSIPAPPRWHRRCLSKAPGPHNIRCPSPVPPPTTPL
jgi:hypothetical protein